MPNEVELERLLTRFTADASQYLHEVKHVEEATKNIGKRWERSVANGSEFGRTLDGLSVHMSSLVGQMRAMAALESPFAMIKKGVGLAAEAEHMEASFGVMLQSAKNGRILIADMIKFAASTPLNFRGIQEASQLLLQFGIDGKEIIPTLRMIGDAAGGDQQRLMRLALAFGQARGAGRLMGQDLLQMVSAGFNPLQEIARTTGRSVSDLRASMERGEITIDMLKNAFKTATAEGGRFFNGMEVASKTLKGLFSTMQDDIEGLLRTVGKDVMERFHLKDLVRQVSAVAQELVTWFDNLSDSTKTMISSIAIVLGSFGSLIIAWKVGRIMLGIFAGTLEDILVTTRILPVVNFLLNLSFTNIIGTVRTLTGLNYLLSFSFTKLGHTIKGVILSITSWTVIGAIVLGIVMTIAAVIEELGGFQAALDFAKDTGVSVFQWFKGQWAQFVEWIRPVTDALEGLWNTAVTELRQNLVQAFNFVKEKANELVAWVDAKWKKMGLGAIPAWEEIRTAVVKAIIFIEYTITHMGQMWELTWAGLKLAAVSALKLILDNILLVLAGPILAGPVLYPLLVVFTTNWKEVWTVIVNVVEQALVMIGTAFPETVLAMSDILKKFLKNPLKGINVNEFADKIRGIFHEINLDELKQGKTPQIAEIFGVNKLRDQLQAEFDKIKGTVGGDFEEFYQRRLKELGAIQPIGTPSPKAPEKWEDVQKAVDNTAGAIKKARHEAEKFDAALSGSAEALYRVTNFRQLVGQNRVSTSLSSNPNISSPRVDYQQQAYQTTYLKDIRNVLIEQAKKRTLVIEGAGLNR